MIEIERKFRITTDEKKRITAILKKNQSLIKKNEQIDEVFLFEQNDFTNFVQGQAVLRLRETDNRTLLTLKKTTNVNGDALEYETEVSSAEKMRNILIEMGYRSVVKIHKARLEAEINGMMVAVDHVYGLGDFLEIEIISKIQSDDLVKKIFDQAKKMGIKSTKVETKKYDYLLLQRK